MPGSRKPVELHREARAELNDSVLFYRERGGEVLVQRFKKEIADAFNAIAEHPERYSSPPDIPQARRIRLIKFPFSIIYVVEQDKVWVVAVAHASRRPGYWLERLVD